MKKMLAGLQPGGDLRVDSDDSNGLSRRPECPDPCTSASPRPIFFHVDADTLHDRAIAAAEPASRSSDLCSAAACFQPKPDERLRVEMGGVCFAHPIGLSAGYDKNGRGAPFWVRSN